MGTRGITIVFVTGLVDNDENIRTMLNKLRLFTDFIHPHHERTLTFVTARSNISDSRDNGRRNKGLYTACVSTTERTNNGL